MERPELQGEDWGWTDGRYRLYTVDHVPFDFFPEYPEGPASVVHTTWCKSTSRLDRFFSSPSVVAADDGLVTLNVYRFSGPTDRTGERHPLDGTKYATTRDADRAAYEAGVTAFMVYERDAARFGLVDA